MTTLNDSVVAVFERLEEVPSAPVFWTTYEAQNAVVEAWNEAALITGVVQVVQSTPLTLPIDTTYIDMPAGAIALLRMVGPNSIQKTELYALDKLKPGWAGEGGSGADPAVQAIQYWFPVGLDMFGIYPQLTVEQMVQITYLAYPVTESPGSYTGNETNPFQQEFQDGLQDYAAHVLRLKEAGQEFEASQVLYQNFLNTMRDLSVFQARHDSLVFSRAVGATVRIIPVTVR